MNISKLSVAILITCAGLANANLLSNAGFEIEGAGGSEDAADWSRTLPLVVRYSATEVGHGYYTMLLKDDWDGWHWAEQILPVSPGVEYFASAQFKGVMQAGEVAYVYMGWIDAGGSELGDNHAVYTVGDTDYQDYAWVTRSVTATAPANAVQVAVRVMFFHDGGKDSALFADNVIFKSMEGADTLWYGGTVGDWEVAGNWDTGVPTANDQAFIANAADVVTVNNPGAVAAGISMDSGGKLVIGSGANLTVGEGRIGTGTGINRVEVDGTFAYTGGNGWFKLSDNWAGAHGQVTMTINPGGSFTAVNGVFLVSGGDANIIVNGGTFSRTGSMHLGADAGRGAITVQNGGQFHTDVITTADGGTVSITINDGVSTIGALYWDNGGSGTRTLNMNGGQLTLGGLVEGDGCVFNISGGELLLVGTTLADVNFRVSGPHWNFAQTKSVVDMGGGTIRVASVPVSEPTIVSFSVFNNVMKIVIDASSGGEYYHPMARSDLSGGTWGCVQHSDDGVHPFLITNLSYSTADASGINKVIYVQADTAQKFFNIKGFVDSSADIIISLNELAITEGSVGSSYYVSLPAEPEADVRVDITATADISLNNGGTSVTLTFSPVNWNTPQIVSVEAADDLAKEATEYIDIHHDVSSLDPYYNGALVDDVKVKVYDNDALSRNVANLPTISQLPDPFLMNNGNRVSTTHEWQQRRKEIKGILQYYEYGFMAPKPDDWYVSLISSDAWPGGSLEKYTMYLDTGSGGWINFRVYVYIPDEAGPHPVVMNPGNDSSKAALCMDRGYMLVAYDQQDLGADVEGADIVGPAQAAYPESDWGDLGVWAWGASRTMDYLATRSDVDFEHVIIRGHSRAGKVALIAGAFDERFAMVAPNGAGTGGPSVFRIRNSGAETLEIITRPSTFASWFQDDFRSFSNLESKLPFDQHWLNALVAPRLLVTTDAIDDLWSNTLGNQASREAAQHVYDFLGAGEIGMHFRSGGHENYDEDYIAMLDFADWKFYGISTTDNFDYDPHSYTPTYTWGTPVNSSP